MPPTYPAKRLARKSGREPTKTARPVNPTPAGGTVTPSTKATPKTARMRAKAIPTIKPKTAVMAPCNPPLRPAFLAATKPPTR